MTDLGSWPRSGSKQLDILGLRGGSRALFLARLARTHRRGVFCVVHDDDLLESLAQDIRLFTDLPVLVYPSFEIPPYTPLAPDPATVASRLSCLYHLQDLAPPFILLTSIEALIRRIVPKKVLLDHCELLIRGEDCDRDALLDQLIANGYLPCDLVRHPGDLAIRGGIVDVFSPSDNLRHSLPLRLDFFGDTLESIRPFDPLSQRSRDDLAEAVLLPASDIFFHGDCKARAQIQQIRRLTADWDWPLEQTAAFLEQLQARTRFPGIEFALPLLYVDPAPQSLLAYPNQPPLIIFQEPVAIRERLELLWDRIRANYREGEQTSRGLVPPEELFLTPVALQEATASRINLCPLPDPDSGADQRELYTGSHKLLAQEIAIQRQKHQFMAPLVDRIQRWLQRQEKIVLACNSRRQRNQLKEMLSGYQIPLASITPPCPPETVKAGVVSLSIHPLSQGFDLDTEHFHILSAGELFGNLRLHTGTGRDKPLPETPPLVLDELGIGDIVVHREQGLGRFQGLVNMDINGRRHDCMQIEYRDGDLLYVPVDRLHWVSRYRGLTDAEPRLDRLGSQRWQSAKKKVTDAVWEVAQELLEIYGKRSLRQGHVFGAPGDLYHQVATSFPFEETQGQAQAIAEVLADLQKPQPMDRLICGDVGYGKTEVAVRAACKVIEDGFQVAVLVPTTVLAEQHATTFRERFASLPIQVTCLNRFRTPAEQRRISQGVREGTIDLVVGTHRLLSTDIVFRRLGLLIIDEEHRFGVTHKEKIKKIKATVDVLTLTATPIPRTLQMSLLGIRDLSIISTPPSKRRSVKTFLARHDHLVIREAIQREMQRGGQIFFVHNRVRSIGRVGQLVASLVPQARVGIAHGQMSGHELEEIMIRFIRHEIDVLVCTTIIESGLDISNANTIIINRADHLGLADIYQLRGRVGRSARQSYAYLLVPSLDHLTADANKRLRALMDCSELGGGFKLAMNDLQIRGGGNLLGVSQSGHIAAVGYDLYLELLQSTVKKLKAREEKTALRDEAVEPEINLHMEAFLPDTYIPDAGLRYQLYQRISATRHFEELADLHEELEDRFGRLPTPAVHLLAIIDLRLRLSRLGISKLEQGPANLVLTFTKQTRMTPEPILQLIKKAEKSPKQQGSRFTPDRRLIVPMEPGTPPLEAIRSLLDFFENNP